MKKKTFYELSEEEQEAILVSSANPSEAAYGRDLIELRPSKLIDPDKTKPKVKHQAKDADPDEETEDLIANSPFPWSEETGFVVPPGEDVGVLSGKLSQEQINEVMQKAKKIIPNEKGITAHQAISHARGDVEIISTDSVDDRFDNI